MKLSVTMCNYNHGMYVERAVEAVLSQSRPPDEFILLDDGSTDGSRDILKKYASYPTIRFIQHETNQGFFKTLQEMRTHVTGGYLHSASADDYILPGFYKSAMSLAEQHPNAGLILAPMIAQDAKGREWGRFAVKEWSKKCYADPARFLSEYLEKESPGHALGASTIYRWDALREAGDFRAELGPWNDSFVARAIGLKYGACYIPDPGVVWVCLSQSLCQSSFRDRKLMLDVIEKMTKLMRSVEFRDTFSEAYVVEWRKRSRRMILLYSSTLMQFVVNLGFSSLNIPVFRHAVSRCADWLRAAMEMYVNARKSTVGGK